MRSSSSKPLPFPMAPLAVGGPPWVGLTSNIWIPAHAAQCATRVPEDRASCLFAWDWEGAGSGTGVNGVPAGASVSLIGRACGERCGKEARIARTTLGLGWVIRDSCCLLVSAWAAAALVRSESKSDLGGGSEALSTSQRAQHIVLRTHSGAVWTGIG